MSRRRANYFELKVLLFMKRFKKNTFNKTIEWWRRIAQVKELLWAYQKKVLLTSVGRYRSRIYLLKIISKTYLTSIL